MSEHDVPDPERAATGAAPDTGALLAAWTEAAERIGAQHDVEVEGERLLAAYGRSDRRYHDVAHLAAVLDHVDTLASLAHDADVVRVAAWFHDAVYDTGRTDNEAVSAALAETVLDRLDVAEEVVAEVGRLVRLTGGHECAPDDRDGHVLCDADLAVLGSESEDYLAYATAVRLEYAHVPDDTFCTARAGLLQRLLDRPRIFRTPTGYSRWERRARHNVAQEIRFLTHGPRGGSSGGAALPQ